MYLGGRRPPAAFIYHATLTVLLFCNISGKQCGELESVILEFAYEDAEKAAGRWAKNSGYKIIELEV